MRNGDPKIYIMNMILIIGILIFAINAKSDEYSDVEIKTVKITDKIYMLQGKGGNIGVLSGQSGIFMIDDQFAPLSGKIKAAISDISDKPIKFLINTHWHRDHTGGNENFSETGAVILAHENVRKRLNTEQFIKMFDRVIPPANEAALPIITFSRDVTLHLDGEEVKIFHVNSAHTDGDSIIHFSDSNVIHTGDIYFSGRYPFIDLSSGGSVTGMIYAVEKVLEITDDSTKIIPGHGMLSDKIGLKNYLNMLKNTYSQTKKYTDEDQSFDTVIKSEILRDTESEYGRSSINREKFLRIIYDDLKKYNN